MPRKMLTREPRLLRFKERRHEAKRWPAERALSLMLFRLERRRALR